MPPISRTQVAPVLKAKDYALIETYSTELLNALTICNSIFALYGDEMVIVGRRKSQKAYGWSKCLKSTRRFDSSNLHKLNTNTYR